MRNTYAIICFLRLLFVFQSCNLFFFSLFFRQTAIIKPSQDFQIFYYEDNKATLVIKEVFPEDAGTFTCVAKNCVGFASSSAELIVNHPLSVSIFLRKECVN